jgi:hypothetical protein
MADQNHSDLLNRLLVRIYRGVLQYAVECWPWSAAAESNGVEPPEQRAIEKMAARQQQSIARLVELLSKRRATVDFGVYPDNSELHYVSLDYLIGKLVADEERLVTELEAAQKGLEAIPRRPGLSPICWPPRKSTSPSSVTWRRKPRHALLLELPTKV